MLSGSGPGGGAKHEMGGAKDERSGSRVESGGSREAEGGRTRRESGSRRESLSEKQGIVEHLMKQVELLQEKEVNSAAIIRLLKEKVCSGDNVSINALF